MFFSMGINKMLVDLLLSILLPELVEGQIHQKSVQFAHISLV